jgi:stage IV sporulation protein FB
VYRSYGLRSTVIVREFFSGVTPEAAPPTALQRIVVALSYPAACLLLAALVYYSNEQFEWGKTSLLAEVVYFILLMIALFWAVIGLLPIFPYPGGQVMLEVFNLVSPRNGLVMTLVISILVGVAYIAYSVLVFLAYLPNIRVWGKVPLASIFVAVFFALSVMQNWQILGYARAQRRQFSTYDDYGDDNRAPWER